MTDSRRGFVPTDEIEFDNKYLILLKNAQQDILYLLENGYQIKQSSTFVGNHYMLSERQRLAVVRATSVKEMIQLRKGKELTDQTISKQVVIDGLNTIITLEVALSCGILIRCMDGCIRDLAGLRGTYRLIPQTDQAIVLIGNKLKELKVSEVLIYLDAPVSNTGRLKTRIFELLAGYPFSLTVDLVNPVDVILQQSEHVITSDAIILNHCKSWFNLNARIVKEIHSELVDLSTASVV